MKLDVLGRTLSGQGLPEMVLERLRARWMFPEHVAAPSDYRVSLEPAAVDLDDWSHTQPQVLEGLTVPVEVRADQTGFSFEDGCGRLECRHLGQRTQVRLELSPDLTALSFAYEDALHLAIVEGLRCSGLLSLHVAAVMFGEQTTVFAGPSGRGKSTTLLQAIQAGGVPVAEDLVWYDPASGLVYGWERVVRLLPESLKYLPSGVSAAEWPVSGDGKTNIPYTAFTSSPVQRGGTPLRRYMVLERRPDQPSSLEPLSAREAVLAVWESTGLPLAQQARQQTQAQLQSLLGQADFYRLFLGSTPLPFGSMTEAASECLP